ncbi:MAG TPA: type II toxin-antitoxin system RelE/ParE family toxin [Pirellulaceae bacterium]|jgi:mRNA-degrading endonuclease RelE of RelBE toxin-antitoxin system
MKYRVFWTPDAERELDEILEASADFIVVGTAAKELDRQLISNPYDVGESRDRGTRVGFVRPLAVQYEVMDDVATVIVFGVWRTDRQR